MRRMILSVSAPFLAQLFKDGSGFVEVVKDPLPADARIVDVRMNHETATIYLIVESETFAEAKDPSWLPDCPSPQFSRLSKSAYLGG